MEYCVFDNKKNARFFYKSFKIINHGRNNNLSCFFLALNSNMFCTNLKINKFDLLTSFNIDLPKLLLI